MWLIRLALRRPISVMVAAFALLLGAWLSIRSAPADIFPSLGIPVIYVVQPYGGMAPDQMESQFVTYYEYHFLYIAGLDHIESQSIQGAALLKLYFQPGTDIAQSVAQVTAMTFRATSFMPPGTLPAFIVRFDAGSIPAGQLVFSSDTQSESEIQDAALYRVRPMLGTLPGVSAPPPFGGKVRTIVIDLNPDSLRSFGISPLNVVQAVLNSNLTLPSGNAQVRDFSAIVHTNAIADQVSQLGDVALRLGAGPTVFIHDLGKVYDGSDIVTQVALINGRPTVYMPVIKRADASTLKVVNAVKGALPRMQAMLPVGMRVNFEFDQSVYVTSAIRDLLIEGAIGAVLTGLMVLLFLADWRSAGIVIITIPLSILSAFIALRFAGETVNIMTLGGLALAVGILVDEATVAIENIHTHMAQSKSVARAVADGMAEVIEPRFIAVVCIIAVFTPSFFMAGIGRALFPPLALAVAFSMIASYLVSNTVLPVLSVWFLEGEHRYPHSGQARQSFFDRFRTRYRFVVDHTLGLRWPVLGIYVVVVGLLLIAAEGLGTQLFPNLDTGQFQLRIHAPAGTDLAHTQEIAREVEKEIGQEAGVGNAPVTLATIGVPNWQYPVDLVFLWNSGPQDAVLQVALGSAHRLSLPIVEERLRKKFAHGFPGVRFSFEAGDIVSQILNYGSPTPVEVTVWGRNFDSILPYATHLRTALERVPELRDVQLAEALDYPTLNVDINRVLAGQLGVTVSQVAGSVVDATASSVLISRNYWVDPKSGIPYPIEVRVPTNDLAVPGSLRHLPVMPIGATRPLVSDVATVSPGTTMGQIDHLNNQRSLNIVANISGDDYGRAAKDIDQAISSVGAPPPAGVTVESRGQLAQMASTLGGLRVGLVLAIVVVVLILAANFESVRDAIVVLSSAPAVLAGVVLTLLITRNTLNVESFMGAIMAVGVAVANAVLLVTFARQQRRAGDRPTAAIAEAAERRLRPILMTTLAMVAGMIPMAIGIGGGATQTAPLGVAVIGGLLASLFATLLVLPVVFDVLTPDWPARSNSLDPYDRESIHFEQQ